MISKTLYITITNQCNYSCNSCQIGCNPINNGFMSFSTFQKILCEDVITPINIIFDGGESLLHPNLYLFLEYIDTVINFKSLIIKTNGRLLPEHREMLIDTISRHNLNVSFDVKISSDIISQYSEHLSLCKQLLDDNDFKLTFDVVYTTEEDKNSLIEQIEAHEIPLDLCTFTIVKAYGTLKDSDYPKIYAEDNVVCYASDGKNFGNDFSARADYEIQLSKNIVPVFDSINHRGLWLESQKFLSDISFENQDDIKLTLEEFQMEYIQGHINEYTKDMIQEGFTSYAEYYSFLFHDDEIHNPFITNDVFGNKLAQEIFKLTELMTITLDLERFYHYKKMAITLSNKLAYMPVKEEIKTTDLKYCCSIKKIYRERV